MRTTAAPATIAHRGASAEAPENTLAAVARAVELGCDLVEVDVQRTRDGVLVLTHDTDLTRTTDAAHALPEGTSRDVRQLTDAQVQRLDAGAWFSAAYAGERVPTLAQVLDVLAGSRTGLLLEVKKPALHPGIEADVSALLRRFRGFRDTAVAERRLVVQSFDHAAMRRFADLEPTVPVGLLGRPPVRRLAGLATWAAQVNPGHRRVTRAYVRAVQAVGMACHVWTVDRPADMERVLGLGVDGVITNRPDLLARALTPPLPVA
jgi:glycerophosphoryl diester phosphodiesterase